MKFEFRCVTDGKMFRVQRRRIAFGITWPWRPTNSSGHAVWFADAYETQHPEHVKNHRETLEERETARREEVERRRTRGWKETNFDVLADALQDQFNGD